MADEGFTIEVTGLDDVLSRYMKADKFAEDELTQAMGRSLDLTATDAAIYPAESEANAPPPPYYIRGTGTQYANSNRGESRQLNEHWQKETVLQNDGVIGTVKVLESEVPYAKYVHHPNWQIPKHAERKWRTTVQITSDVKDRVLETFKLAAAKVAAKLRG